MQACDSNSLVAAATCLEQQIPPGFQNAVIIYLLCQILTNGGTGGGGSGQLVTYTSGTPANPANTALPAFAYDPTGNLPSLGWNVASQGWF